MLDISDLTPFVDLTEAQARIVIDDIEADLDKIAPSLVASDDPSVIRITRVAALRYANLLKDGGRRVKVRQATRGPFDTRTEMADTGPSGVNLFTPGEIEQLQVIANATVVAGPVLALPVGSFPPAPECWRS